MFELHGATALLTGAGGGLGRYIARALAEEGVNLALSDHPDVDLDSLLAELRATGVSAEQVPAELTDREQVLGLVGRVEGQLGPLDVLVNNAGIEFIGPFLGQTSEELERIATVNLVAVMELTRQALPGMLERRRGHVVNLASLAGKAAFPYLVAYTATKFGVVGFTHALRAELGSSPVGLSAICPGVVRRVGMFGRIEDQLPEVPREVGGMGPERVGEAVVSAIRENRAEVILNETPSQPLVALAALAPGLTASLIRRQRKLVEFSHRAAEARGRL